MQTDKLFLNLSIRSIILALIVIVLGADARLSLAGLGVKYEYGVLETVAHDGVATFLLASMGTLLFFTRYPDK